MIVDAAAVGFVGRRDVVAVDVGVMPFCVLLVYLGS